MQRLFRLSYTLIVLVFIFLLTNINTITSGFNLNIGLLYEMDFILRNNEMSNSYELAIKWLNKAADNTISLNQATRELGRISYTIGEFGLAENWLEVAVNLSPENPFGHILLGDTYREQGFFEKALDEYSMVGFRNRERVSAILYLQLLTNADVEEGCKILEKVWSLDPGNMVAAYEIIETCESVTNNVEWESAIKYFDLDKLKLDENELGLIQLAEYLPNFVQKQYWSLTKALRVIDFWIVTQRYWPARVALLGLADRFRDPGIFVSLATLYEHQEDWRNALQAADSALQLDESLINAQRIIVLAHHQLEKDEDNMDLLDAYNLRYSRDQWSKWSDLSSTSNGIELKESDVVVILSDLFGKSQEDIILSQNQIPSGSFEPDDNPGDDWREAYWTHESGECPDCGSATYWIGYTPGELSQHVVSVCGIWQEKGDGNSYAGLVLKDGVLESDLNSTYVLSFNYRTDYFPNAQKENRPQAVISGGTKDKGIFHEQILLPPTDGQWKLFVGFSTNHNPEIHSIRLHLINSKLGCVDFDNIQLRMLSQESPLHEEKTIFVVN